MSCGRLAAVLRRALVLAVVLAAAAGGATADTRARPILVVGATGQQGGAVVDALLASGFSLRGLTRDPAGARSRALAQRGAEMVRGDLGDPESLVRALAGTGGVFLMTDFWEHGYEGEVAHGRNMIEAARAAGVRRLVYSSVGSADRDTGIPHFESKREVERLLAESGLHWTVLRPVSFMENWRDWPAALADGVWRTPLSPDTELQHVSVVDIGRFAARAFADPRAWRGVALDLAGDKRSVRELADLLAEIRGAPVRLAPMSWEAYAAANGEELADMTRWFEETGYDVDVAALRARYPDMVRFEDYLRAVAGTASP